MKAYYHYTVFSNMVGWLYAPYTHLSDYPNIGEKERIERRVYVLILYSFL
jgi:hypothetical protein